jgi:hypothetical protein
MILARIALVESSPRLDARHKHVNDIAFYES